MHWNYKSKICNIKSRHWRNRQWGWRLQKYNTVVSHFFFACSCSWCCLFLHQPCTVLVLPHTHVHFVHLVHRFWSWRFWRLSWHWPLLLLSHSYLVPSSSVSTRGFHLHLSNVNYVCGYFISICFRESILKERFTVNFLTVIFSPQSTNWLVVFCNRSITQSSTQLQHGLEQQTRCHGKNSTPGTGWMGT